MTEAQTLQRELRSSRFKPHPIGLTKRKITWVYRIGNKSVYYFAYKKEQRFCDHADYLEAWHNYWDDISTGLNSYDAIGNMRADFGGVARKQPIPEVNGIFNDKIEYMLSLIQQSIESEHEG